MSSRTLWVTTVLSAQETKGAREEVRDSRSHAESESESEGERTEDERPFVADIPGVEPQHASAKEDEHNSCLDSLENLVVGCASIDLHAS